RTAVVSEIHRRLCQQARAICIRINHAYRLLGIRSVGTRSRALGGFEILIVEQAMLSSGVHDLQPARVVVDLVNFSECLVYIRHRGDERRPLPDRAADSAPVEGVAPAIAFMPGAASLLEHLQEMECATVIPLVIQMLRQERQAHGEVRVRNWESLPFPKETSSRGYECLTENDGRNCDRSQSRLPIIKSLRISAQIARVERLKIVGSLSVAVEPRDEVEHTIQ